MSTDAEPEGPKSSRDVHHTDRRTIMDAKYNWLIDNGAVRVTLNTVAFALWMATAVVLLEAASKF